MLTFRVTVDLADRLTDVAPHGHRSEVIRQAVEQYLEQYLGAMKPKE